MIKTELLTEAFLRGVLVNKTGKVTGELLTGLVCC